MYENGMSRKKTGRRRAHTPGDRPVMSARMQIAVMAAAASVFGAVAGPAYAKFDIPTGANPSPLFGATPFSQKMLMFEEFGPQPLPSSASAHSLPDPGGCNGPANPATYSGLLDKFLSEPLYPAPQRTANTALPNPWGGANGSVSRCLGRLVTGVIEGRPPSEDFAHQRWSEFDPTAPGAVYFQTAMAGARANGGIRDTLQLHQYKFGEFGPGGLYYDTTGTGTNGTTKGALIRFHPNMPVQDPQGDCTRTS